MLIRIITLFNEILLFVFIVESTSLLIVVQMGQNIFLHTILYILKTFTIKRLIFTGHLTKYESCLIFKKFREKHIVESVYE